MATSFNTSNSFRMVVKADTGVPGVSDPVQSNVDAPWTLRKFETFFGRAAQGASNTNTVYALNPVVATGTFTITSTGPTNNETCTIANVTFTAKTSGATGNQFNINASPTVVAANIAAAVNASSSLSGILTATSAAGVVTFSIVVPGALGNGIQLSAGNLANTVAAAFANGSDGTLSTISLGL
jgi:hypothetical protein